MKKTASTNLIACAVIVGAFTVGFASGPAFAQHDSDAPFEAVLSVPLATSEEAALEGALGALTLIGKPAGKRFSAGDAKLATAVAAQLGCYATIVFWADPGTVLPGFSPATEPK